MRSRSGASTSAGDHRGSFLLGALWVNTLLLLTAVGTLPFYLTMLRTTSRSYLLDQSMALAEAGLAAARWEVMRNGGANLNPTAPGGGWVLAAASACDDELEGNIVSSPILIRTGAPTDALLFGLPVTSCFRRTVGITSGDPDARVMGSFTVWVANYGQSLTRLVSQGSVTNAPPGTGQVIMQDLDQVATFRYAAFGNTGVTIAATGHVFIDSYDSSVGPYALATRKENGNVATNGDGTAAVDLTITNAVAEVHGKALLTSGDTYSITSILPPTGGVATQADVVLPPIQIPTALSSLPITTTLGSAAVVENGQGDFWIQGSYTCNAALHIRSLAVTGTFNMTDNCQLLIDSTDPVTGASRTPAYTSNAIDTNGTGSLLKTGTGTTRIFVLNRGIDLDGGGIGYVAGIPVASRRPQNLQLFIACNVNPCPSTGPNNIAQRLPFYGVVYVNGVNPNDAGLHIWRGSENGVGYTTDYYGAFVTSGDIRVDGFGVGATWWDALIHYDETLATLPLDGSGSTTLGGYRTRSRTWNAW